MNGRPLVLIVEDTLVYALYMQTVLADYADVVVANTATAARKLLTQHHFDLVVLDLLLPDGSGLDILRDLKAVNPAQKVVVNSAGATDQIRDQAVRLGADGVLLKEGHPERIMDFL